MKKGNGMLQIGYVDFEKARYVIERGITPKHDIHDQSYTTTIAFMTKKKLNMAKTMGLIQL